MPQVETKRIVLSTTLCHEEDGETFLQEHFLEIVYPEEGSPSAYHIHHGYYQFYKDGDSSTIGHGCKIVHSMDEAWEMVCKVCAAVKSTDGDEDVISAVSEIFKKS